MSQECWEEGEVPGRGEKSKSTEWVAGSGMFLRGVIFLSSLTFFLPCVSCLEAESFFFGQFRWGENDGWMEGWKDG